MNLYNQKIKPVLFGMCAALFFVSIAKIWGDLGSVEWLEVYRLASESITLAVVVDWVGIKFLE
jgi:hypothetical protein